MKIGSIGFVGGGRAPRFLLQGWTRTGAPGVPVRVADPRRDAVDALSRAGLAFEETDVAHVAASDLVVLAVHPPAMAEAMAAVAPSLRPDAVVLSLAPKITCEAMARALASPRVARMIPNAPSAIGRGFNPVAFGPGVDTVARRALSTLFAPWGEAPEVPEIDLETYALLSAMGPTYMWFQWQVLRELAAGFGLAPDDADRALLKTIEGSAAYLLTAGRPADEVLDTVPVKPLAAHEAAITAAYRDGLGELMAKLRPSGA